MQITLLTLNENVAALCVGRQVIAVSGDPDDSRNINDVLGLYDKLGAAVGAGERLHVTDEIEAAAEQRVARGGVNLWDAIAELAVSKSAVVDVHVVWGERPDVGATPTTYSFATEAEAEAFRKGVDEGTGWLGYQLCDSAACIVVGEERTPLDPRLAERNEPAAERYQDSFQDIRAELWMTEQGCLEFLEARLSIDGEDPHSAFERFRAVLEAVPGFSAAEERGAAAWVTARDDQSGEICFRWPVMTYLRSAHSVRIYIRPLIDAYLAIGPEPMKARPKPLIDFIREVGPEPTKARSSWPGM